MAGSGSSGSGSSSTVDLAELMEHYNTVRWKLSPFFEFWKTLEQARRWKNYKLSWFVVLSAVAVILFPCPAVALLSGVMFIMVTLGTNYLTSTPTPVNTDEAKMIDQDAEEMLRINKEGKKKQKHLVEFRKLLRCTDDALITIAASVDSVIRIFKWEDPILSRRVCILLLVICLSTIWMSVNLMLAMAAVCFFCFNQDFKESTTKQMASIRYGLSKKFRRESFPRLGSLLSLPRSPSFQWRYQPASMEEAPSGTQAPNDHSSLTERSPQGSHSSGTQQPNLQPASVGGADTAAAAAAGSSTSEQAPCSNSVSSASSKLGTQCCNCGASFSSFLKRKHCCNKCGLFFCGSCTVKVTRASLGATAPAALVETVRVCQSCKVELDLQHAPPKTHSMAAAAPAAHEPANKS